MERVNDIVFIVTLHPFEVHGGMPLTFLGQTFSVGNSEESYTQTTKEVRKQIIASGMDTLSIASNENIVKKLNFFFKNRMLYV